MARGDYFPQPEPVLSRRLDLFLGRLATDLATQPFRDGVAALVLGGGYGRGEGGVFRAAPEAAPQLYNDLEFYLFAAPPAHDAVRAWCGRWERSGSAELELDVEFKILPADALRVAEPSMFFFDLLQGHRLVWGDAAVLQEAPSRLREPALLPAEEAARLLFNRGSGLLFAAWQLEQDPADRTGFVRRNHAKARLALADAVLALAGRHDGSCRERARRLQTEVVDGPPHFPLLRRWHAQGVQFKLHPRHDPCRPDELRAAQWELVDAWIGTFLWIEARRFGCALPDADAYLARGGRLFPARSRWRNLALRARDLMRRGSCLPCWTDYSRAPLMRALVAALDGQEARAAREIGRSAGTWRTHYRRWWSFYN